MWETPSQSIVTQLADHDNCHNGSLSLLAETKVHTPAKMLQPIVLSAALHCTSFNNCSYSNSQLLRGSYASNCHPHAASLQIHNTGVPPHGARLAFKGLKAGVQRSHACGKQPHN